MDMDPVSAGASAVAVASLAIADVDMSTGGAAIAYEFAAVPLSNDAYYISAFLDDNNNVNPADPDSAGPDRGDLIALNGMASFQVVIDSEGTTTCDIVLNMAMPF